MKHPAKWRAFPGIGSAFKVATLILLLLGSLFLSVYFHFIVHTDVLYSHFFYLPIVLAGYWWGRKALPVAVFLAGLAIIPHFMGYASTPVVTDFVRSGMFMAVALLVGTLREHGLTYQRSLVETRNYLTNLIRYSSVPIIVWDTEKKITLFNVAFQRLTGYHEDNVLGQPLDILFSDGNRGPAMEKIERALGGEFWEAQEIPIRCRDGHEAICLWNSANIYVENNGRKLRATIAQGQDITNRKEAEEQIARQNNFLNTVVESLTHPFIVIDATDYSIVMGNSAALNERLSKGATCYSVSHHRDQPCDGIHHPCPLKLVKETRRPAVVEHVHFDGSGNPKTMEINCYPILDERGDLVQIIEYIMDVTERKTLTEEHEKLIEELSASLEKVKTLRGLVPICASCKKIRDDKGYWNQLEKFISDHSEAVFSHGICPACMEKLYKGYSPD